MRATGPILLPASTRTPGPTRPKRTCRRAGSRLDLEAYIGARLDPTPATYTPTCIDR